MQDDYPLRETPLNASTPVFATNQLNQPLPREKKKENGHPKGGMGGRHAATTQGFFGEGCDALAVAHLGVRLFLSLFAVFSRQFSLQPSCHLAVVPLSSFSPLSLLPLSPARPRESSAEGALFDRAQNHCERFRRVQSSNRLRSLRNAFACASPRPARCGASWPFARACPADSPNIPSAAAKSCAAARRAATAARALVPRLERHESGAAGLRAERPPSAQPRIASMPTALPRRPKQARAMLTPFMLLTLSRRRLCASQIHKTT